MNKFKKALDSNQTKSLNLRKSFAISISLIFSLQLFVSPATASGTYDGTNGTVNCTTGDFTVQNNVVTANNNCSGTASIPNGVTEIGASAFAGESNLTTVLMPPSVTTIADNSFSETPSLMSIAFSSNLLSIGNYAFNNSTSLSSISIPSSVTSIGNYAFSGASSLLSVVIPTSVTSIGAGPFRDATSLTSISVSASNPNFSSRENVLYNKTGTRLIQFPAGKSGNAFLIPSGVTTIGASAFSGSTNLSSVTIPTSVTSIESAAFARATAISSIDIPQGVSTIENFTFSGASALSSVTIPPTITHIGDGAFNEATALQSIRIPASVSSMGVGVFSDATSLQRVVFWGNAPTGAGNLQYGVSPQPTALIRSNASGFGSAASTWRGLTVSIGVHVVTFDSLGGSIVEPISFTLGQSISEPIRPVKSGQTFAGWMPLGGGEVISFPFSPTQDVILNAKWNPSTTTSPATEGLAPTTPTGAISKTIQKKKSYVITALAKLVGIKVASKTVKIDIVVSQQSKNSCVRVGTKLKTLKSGKCVVTFILQETIRRNGKLLKPTKTKTTLIVK